MTGSRRDIAPARTYRPAMPVILSTTRIAGP